MRERAGAFAVPLLASLLLAACGPDDDGPKTFQLLEADHLEIAIETSALAPCHGPWLSARIVLDGPRGVLTVEGNTGTLLATSSRLLDRDEVQRVRDALAGALALPEESAPNQLGPMWIGAGSATVTVTSPTASTSMTSVSPLTPSELLLWLAPDEPLEDERSPLEGLGPSALRARSIHGLMKALTGRTVAEFRD